MQNLPEKENKLENSRNLNSEEEDSGGAIGRFGRELRLKRNSCPLCNFVQKESEKDNPFPVEEWIYLAHLKNVHGIEP